MSCVGRGKGAVRGLVQSGERADRIRTATLSSNFTVRIFCQVSFCRCIISGLELIFSVVDLDFKGRSRF